MGFPHRGLLRKLRQSVRHRGHAPLTFATDLPRFTYLDSDMLRRLPVALFILACHKLAGSSRSDCEKKLLTRYSAYMSDYLRPVTAIYRCRFPLHDLSDHIGHGDFFNSQRRINRFMFFNLSELNLEDHLGLVISPQSTLSAGYITLQACAQVLHRHTRWDCWASRNELPVQYSRQTRGSFEHPCSS